MLRFLWRGIIRDRHRSRLPVIVVAIGVCTVVFMTGFIDGMMNNMVSLTAKFDTGHLKVVTREYQKDMNQKPIDYAILQSNEQLAELRRVEPAIDWVQRIYFGGLLDIPDENGETKGQGPVAATAYDLLSPASKEAARLNFQKALVSGHLIQKKGEILVSNDFAEKFNVNPGDTVTFFGSTMYGSMAVFNYSIAGIVRFGVGMLDKGAVVVDLSDARFLLDMDDACGEILGFLPNDKYDRNEAEMIKEKFNAKYIDDKDEFAPVMLQLADQNGMAGMLDYFGVVSIIMIGLLVLALSIVLWNAGLLNGIRRYNEFGLRLALGEEKNHIYGTLLSESLLIGILGSIVGTVAGIGVCLILQKYGIDYSKMMENISMMLDPVVRAKVSPKLLYIGFIPGVLSVFIGTALAGRAIYKRNTTSLFKELE